MNTPKNLVNTSGVGGVLYTVPYATKTIVNHISITNTDAATAITIDVEVAGTKWRSAVIIPPNESVEFNGSFTLNELDTLSITSDHTYTTYLVSGLEVS